MFRYRILLPLLFALSCSGAGEELATFKDGAVTRGEIRTIFEVMMGPEAATQASVDRQFSIVQNYAYMLLAAREARATGMDKAEDLAKVPDMFDEQAALEAFNIMLKRDSDSHTFTMADFQFLWLGRGKPDDQSRRPEAEELLGKLNANLSDSDVENLISEKTEKGRYKFLGGYMDPHCVSCVPDRLMFLSKPLEETTDKKFVLVEDPSGYWLVRRVAKREVSGGDLKDLFKDHHVKTMRIALKNLAKLPENQQEDARKKFVLDEKQIETLATNQAQAQVRREMGRVVSTRLEKLRKDKKLEIKDVAQDRDRETNPADDAVLFSYEGGQYTYGDFKKAIGEKAATEPFGRQMGLLHGLLIPYFLFDKFEPDFKEAKESDLAEFLLNFRKDEQLARYYFTEKVKDIEVSDKDVKEWYELRKESLYKGKGLGAVRDAIEQQLSNSRRQEKAVEIQKQLAEKYDLKVFREKLTEGKL